MRLRRLAVLLLPTVMTAALAATSLTAPADAAPPRAADPVVKHSGRNWVWYGPKSWDASYSTYGITVMGTSGAILDLGFSTTLCAKGSTWNESVTNWFAAKRRELKQSTGLKITAASAIARPSGATKFYRRQVAQFTVDNGATHLQGIVSWDYDFSTTSGGANYCYQRNLAKYSRTAAWKTTRPVLVKVEQSLAYSGPGAPGEDPDHP